MRKPAKRSQKAEPQEPSVLSKLGNVCIGLVVMLAWVFGTFELLKLMGMPMGWGGASPFFMFFLACIFAPLWEELVFRVAPMKLAKAIGPEATWPAVIISSFLFGMGHGNPYFINIIWQGMMGALFCYIYIKNNYSYWPNVLLHGLYNFVVIYLLR